jgi:hypothetical protein
MRQHRGVLRGEGAEDVLSLAVVVEAPPQGFAVSVGSTLFCSIWHPNDQMKI